MKDCPVGTKSHNAHDDRIRELEAFKKAVDRTSRVLAERVVKLESALLVLNRKYEEKDRKLREGNSLLKKWM